MARFAFARSPTYPKALRAKHIEGTGCFRMHMNEQGTVTSVVVVRSTGHRELDHYATVALRLWRAKRSPQPWTVDMSLSFVADE